MPHAKCPDVGRSGPGRVANRNGRAGSEDRYPEGTGKVVRFGAPGRPFAGIPAMSALSYDVRSAFRSLIRNRGVAVISILTLALALGATTAIFSVVNGILLEPLPFPAPEELVTISAATPFAGAGIEMSWSNFSDIRDQHSSLENAAAWNSAGMFLYEGEEPRLLRGADANAELFTLLGVKPMHGRVFTPEEDRTGGEPVMVISHELWQSQFGSDPSIVGDAVRTSPTGATRTVLGVMPPRFKFPVSAETVDFWTPLGESLSEQARSERNYVYLNAVGRLRDGASLASASAELDALSGRLEREYPDSNTGVRFEIRNLQSHVVGEVRPALWTLLAAVLAVVLIACANVANLLLGRAMSRKREIGVRAALGASRLRILKQLLLESVALGVAAGAVGLAIGLILTRALVSFAPPDVPRIEAVGMDGTVFLFGLLVSVTTGLLFGIAPALAAARSNPVESLRDGGTRGSTESRRSQWVRRSLVVAEIAISLLLLVAAGLFIRSFGNVLRIDPGYDPGNVTSMFISARSAHESEGEVIGFHEELRERIAALPGVEAVSATRLLPFSFSNNAFDFTIEGRPIPPPDQRSSESYVVVAPRFFETIGIPVKRGRTFTDRDEAGASGVIVVSESFVRRHFPGEDPLGRRIEVNGFVREVVGIVGDVRQEDPTLAPVPVMFVPHAQAPQRALRVIVRTTGSRPIEAELRGIVRQMDALQPIIEIQTLEQIQRESFASRRLALALLIGLAALAFLLAVAGIYSVMSYSVTQRRAEIGVRMAFGAERGDIVGMVLRQVGLLLAIGTGLGLLASVSLSRFLRRFLWDLEPTDPATLGAVVVILAVVALLSGWIPARRASRIDPVQAIRSE